MIKELAGRIIQFGEENKPVRGCTISKQLYQSNTCSLNLFSLAEGTSISAEQYEYHKLLTVYDGKLHVFTSEGTLLELSAGDSVLTEIGIPVGMKSETGCVYLEIEMRKDERMNHVIKAGEVFKMADLVPYQDGKIVNMDLASNSNMKFVLMSFDEGTGLSEHAAPGEALVFALDGEALIGYEGKEYTLKAGETFKFDKFGKHSVKAVKKFKMALMLILD